MKDKTRLTLMICTTANGDKIPIAVVGKSAQPRCFRDQDIALPYTNQSNAWFDKNITKWWLDHVLLPYHFTKHGRGVPCLLLLDNCSAHKLTDEEFKAYEDQKVYIHFLPPNLTSKHQPADMGMIAALKVGYRTKYLSSLLDLFDVENGYELAVERRKRQLAGCKGLKFGGKATVLDAIDIIHSIWDKDDKYARADGIKRCWRKADILPLSWVQDINNDVGSASMPDKDKKISKEECDELCRLLKNIQIKTVQSGINTATTAYGLADSFASEVEAQNLSNESWEEMVENWIGIEEDVDVIAEEVDEVIENIDDGKVAPDDSDEEDEEGDEEDDSMSEEEAEPTTKLECMKAIDILRKYCNENGAEREESILRKLESSFVRMRSNRATIQQPINNYFSSSS